MLYEYQYWPKGHSGSEHCVPYSNHMLDYEHQRYYAKSFAESPSYNSPHYSSNFNCAVGTLRSKDYEYRVHQPLDYHPPAMPDVSRPSTQQINQNFIDNSKFMERFSINEYVVSQQEFADCQRIQASTTTTPVDGALNEYRKGIDDKKYDGTEFEAVNQCDYRDQQPSSDNELREGTTRSNGMYSYYLCHKYQLYVDITVFQCVEYGINICLSFQIRDTNSNSICHNRARSLLAAQPF